MFSVRCFGALTSRPESVTLVRMTIGPQWPIVGAMTDKTESAPVRRIAWEPLTPRGVAAFAQGSWGRLLVVQAVFAVVAAIAVVVLLRTAWFPTVRAAIRELPAQGQIHAGALQWPDDSPQRLAEGPWLAFTVDLDHSGLLRTPADLEFEFGRKDVRVWSLLGYREWPYAPGWDIAFNRTQLQPWWGAWQPPIFWMTFGGVMIGLMLTWTLLATLYCLLAWLVGFFANRSLTVSGSWKLSGAALLPASLVADAAILLYGVGAINLVAFLAGLIGHWVVGWIYVVISPLFAPRLASLPSSRGNPFAGPATPQPGPQGSKRSNPE